MPEQRETSAQRRDRIEKAIRAMERALYNERDSDERHRLAERIAAHRAGLALLNKHQ